MKPLLLPCGLAVALAIVAFTQTAPQAPPPTGQPAAQKAPPKKGPPPHQLTADEKRRIEARADELAGVIQSLRARQADETLLADVEIYESAARMILEHPEEFHRPRNPSHQNDTPARYILELNHYPSFSI